MSENIIANWLNIPHVRPEKVDIRGESTVIELSRERGGFICSGCKKIIKNGYDCRKVYLRDLSCFEYNSYLALEKFRVNCPSCGIKVEELGFARVFSHCTKRFEDYVAKLCKILPISAVAELLELDWKTVKEIDKRYLAKKFSIPDYSCLKILAIDELSYKSGYRYLTIVLDIVRTRVIWVQEGRRKETLDKFFAEIGGTRAKEIMAIAIDMWDPYLASILKYAPGAKVVFDKFHVIAEYSKMLDKMRNTGLHLTLERRS
jgi:transposase